MNGIAWEYNLIGAVCGYISHGDVHVVKELMKVCVVCLWIQVHDRTKHKNESSQSEVCELLKVHVYTQSLFTRAHIRPFATNLTNL